MKLYSILNPEFGEVFGKLMACKALKGNVAFRLAKLAQKIKENGDIYDKLRIAACEEYAEKDSEGKCIMEENNYKIPAEKMPELNLKVQDMLNVDIEFAKIKMQDLENAELSANDFMVIAELIED